MFVSASTDPVLTFSCSIDEDWSWLEVYLDCDCDRGEEPKPPDKIKILGKDFLLFPGLQPITLIILDSCIHARETASFFAPGKGSDILFDQDKVPNAICSVREYVLALAILLF